MTFFESLPLILFFSSTMTPEQKAPGTHYLAIQPKFFSSLLVDSFFENTLAFEAVQYARQINHDRGKKKLEFYKLGNAQRSYSSI
jgi:hypothetical protein